MKYRVWQHNSGTAPMGLREARICADELEREALTSAGTIPLEACAEIMPAGITPDSPQWGKYIAHLWLMGKRRL